MARDDTLAGYLAVHGRPPAFEGADGRAYSVGIISDDDPGPDGRCGAALLFVRWSDAQAPDGHVESEYLAFGPDARAAEEELGRLSLAEVKHILDRLVGRGTTV